MLSKSFLLTFDWVVNRLASFNSSQAKDKRMMQKIRYIVKLAATRGCKSSVRFFDLLCRSTLSLTQIRKLTKKLATFVSPEEMKVLIAAS